LTTNKTVLATIKITTMTTKQHNTEITQKAIEKVILNNQPFSEIYFQFAKEWVSKRFKSFTSDDIRKAFLDAGNEHPRHRNAWGGCIHRLSGKKLIFDTEKTIPSERPEAHGRLLRIWLSREYVLKQQSNRKTESSLDLFKEIA